MIRRSRLLAVLVFISSVFIVALPSLTHAQERTAVRQGFSFPNDGSARILVFRPDVTVGAQSTGGLFEPRADWTEQARGHIGTALDQALPTLNAQIVRIQEPIGSDAQLLRDYSALFGAVSQSIINYQFFVGNRLETKKRDNRENVFEWTLGEGVRTLPGADQADYALFITTEDHYGSTGRKLLQIFAAAAVGVGVTSGLHAGYAGLVDLQTGNLVWINADFAMGGDVREADGAVRRVSQLLEDFPGTLPISGERGGAAQ